MQIPVHGFLHASPEPESVHGGMPRVQSHLANSMCTSSFPAPLNALPRCTHPVTSSTLHCSVLILYSTAVHELCVGWTLQILGVGWVARAWPMLFLHSFTVPATFRTEILFSSSNFLCFWILPFSGIVSLSMQCLAWLLALFLHIPDRSLAIFLSIFFF